MGSQGSLDWGNTMRNLAALLVLVLLATRLYADDSTFDPNPEHPWNRLHAVLTADEDVPEFQAADRNQRLQTWLFTGPRYARALSELDAFIERKSDRLIRDPVKRALLQSQLWAVFDTVSAPTGDYPRERFAIAWRTSELVQRLALTEAQITALPDNYAATIAAKRFPASHDPENETQAFLPPDLLPVGRAWLAISDSSGFPPAAAVHAQAVQGRSMFYVLVHLPQGISQTRAYTRTLARFAKPYAWEESYAQYPYARSAVRAAADLPQFPAGTQVALVRRMLLPDSDGELRLTPIIESIQIRVYVTDPVADRKYSRQAAFQFRLSPKDLLTDGSGLRPTDHRDARTLFERQSILEGGCVNCHGASGIYSVLTYQQAFVRRRSSPWFEAVSSDAFLNLHGLNWKKSQYQWGLLQGIWKARRESAAAP
jgi:hypothetical protein